MALDPGRIAAICFDVDGTLADTDDAWVQSAQRLLSPLRFALRGQTTLRAARWLVMGVETPGNWAYQLLDRLRLDDEAARVMNFFAHYQNAPYRRLPAVAGVAAMLTRLREHYPLAVVSARGERTTMRFLQEQNLLPLFSAVATAFTCKYTKPYPDPVCWAAERMGAAVERCLMVGDTAADIRAGRAAGAQTVGVQCGFGSEAELRRAGADLILESTAQLGEILAGDAAEAFPAA